MSTNLNYKQVANVTRRTWDVEAYEEKAKARRQQQQQNAAAGDPSKKRKLASSTGTDPNAEEEETKEEFLPAARGAVGPEGSQRAYLKARKTKIDVESKVGTTEMISADAAATIRTSSTNLDDGKRDASSGAVVKSGVGWHCKVCDCFLKDSHTYLDHINGRKHQRKLGFSMRVERSTKDQLLDKLKQITKSKEKQRPGDDDVGDGGGDEQAIDFHDIVATKDEEIRKRREERKKRRKEKKRLQQQQQQQQGMMTANDDGDDDDGDDDDDGEKEEGGNHEGDKTTEGTVQEGEGGAEEDDDEQVVEGQVDPALAAMMGFSGFGGM